VGISQQPNPLRIRFKVGSKHMKMLRPNLREISLTGRREVNQITHHQPPSRIIEDMIRLDLTILTYQDEEGWWIAEIPEVPGAFSQGRTQPEAKAMALDALQLVSVCRRQAAFESHPVGPSEVLPFRLIEQKA